MTSSDQSLQLRKSGPSSAMQDRNTFITSKIRYDGAVEPSTPSDRDV